MIMPRSLSDAIPVGIFESDSAKRFLDAIWKKFKASNKLKPESWYTIWLYVVWWQRQCSWTYFRMTSAASKFKSFGVGSFW